MFAGPVAAALFAEKDLHDPVVVSPDAAGVYRAKEFRSVLSKNGYDASLAMVIRQKDRMSTNKEIVEVVRAGEGSLLTDKPDGQKDYQYGDTSSSGKDSLVNDYIVGNVKDCDVIIIDDIIDTGGTIINAANALKLQGARKIYVFSTHGVLSGDAIDRLNQSNIDEICITDTIPFQKDKLGPKFTIMTLAPLIAEVIHRVHTKSSVSELWKENKDTEK